jgi:hypothetical protein
MTFKIGIKGEHKQLRPKEQSARDRLTSRFDDRQRIRTCARWYRETASSSGIAQRDVRRRFWPPAAPNLGPSIALSI